MRHFLDRSFTVRRFKKINATRSAFSATGTAYGCGIQQLTPEAAQLHEGQIGRMYDVFVDETSANVRVGDEVVILDIAYGVRGIEVIDFGGTPFLNLVVERLTPHTGSGGAGSGGL